MNEAIEFAFDGITKEEIPLIIKFRKKIDNVMNVSDSYEEERDPQVIFYQEYWNEIMNSSEGAATFINLHKCVL